jgi:sulfate transport system substrate-binding protein
VSLSGCGDQTLSITNVSYDPTRELYAEYNSSFEKWYEKTYHQKVNVVQSHGGSGKQALEVDNGLKADVVSLALQSDVDILKTDGLIKKGYINSYPNSSSPYTSTIVLLVRKNNPKKIHDWEDLTKKGIGIITPNPKTSGGARWNYLAAWYGFEKAGYSQSEIKAKMKALYKNVLVLDSGSRAATTTFCENGEGDVLITWENEAYLTMEENPGAYEIIDPSASIVSQPTVALVNEVAKEKGTTEVADAYIRHLYSASAQKMIARSYYRPVNKTVYKNDQSTSTSRAVTKVSKHWINNDMDLTTIDHFGGWSKATRIHFKEGGYFDEIYE